MEPEARYVIEREPVKMLWEYLVASWAWMDAATLCIDRMRPEVTP